MQLKHQKYFNMMYWILIHWAQLSLKILYLFIQFDICFNDFSANKKICLSCKHVYKQWIFGDNAAKIQADKNVIFALCVAKYLHNQKQICWDLGILS